MNHRILDFSKTGNRLHIQYRQLLIKQNDGQVYKIPLEDIAVVILSHPQISLSQSVLSGLNNAGAVIVICNQKSLPVGLCCPLIGHHLQSNRMRTQALTPKPVLKRLWQQIVRQKIESQASVLTAIFQDDFDLKSLVKKVKSGDTDNREGVAAKRYWSKLFAENPGFKRVPFGEDPVNIALNYGYGVLRAIIGRAISAAGLHPSLGIFHHNKYNPYCLADDLIEPFRPIVDYCVYQLNQKKYLADGLVPSIKECIIQQLTGRYLVNGLQETLFETAAKMTESLVRVFSEKEADFLLPATLPLGTVQFPVTSPFSPMKEQKIENFLLSKPPF